MMDYQDQLKVQAYLDGELSGAEAKPVEELLARNQEATDLLTELRQTCQALDGFEQGIKMPETREFFWSKVNRGIQSQENRATAAERAVIHIPWSARLRRFLVPASGLAVLALVALIVTREGGGPSANTVETSLADGGGVVYHDFSAGATFVWLSYPPDSESSEEDDSGSLD